MATTTHAPSPNPAPTTSLLEPAPDAKTTGRAETHPIRSAAVTFAIGYAVLTVVMLGIGFLLTHTLASTVGRWDEHVNEYFARHRTGTWNDITKFATAAFNTTPVIVTAAIVAGLLALRHRFREAAFLVTALVLEITVFLPVTFAVARDRPAVPRMNSTPATSSFPSGHTAAATVLFVGIALIVTCCTRNRILRLATSLLGAVVATLVGFGRVYRGLHHPTDVIVGALFGLACLAVAAIAVRAYGRASAAKGSRDLANTPKVN
ncbi:MAG TPA: phosphatase PAP2 family protein [Acidimicrobiia bacterium]|jgi:undecaprenyl-diphosphatase|nr:phosphatase PAP2 family protein [Acidimicrobiia bacterium]